MINQLIEKIQKKKNILKIQDEKELIGKIQYDFMRFLYENKIDLENEDVKREIIQKIQNIQKSIRFKNVQYYSILNKKKISLKYLDSMIFLYQYNENEYHMIISSNLSNPRHFKSEKLFFNNELDMKNKMKELKNLNFKKYLKSSDYERDIAKSKIS